MRIVQFFLPTRGRRLGVVRDDELLDVTHADAELRTTYAAVQQAVEQQVSLAELLDSRLARAAPLRYAELLDTVPAPDRAHVLPPLDHPDPYRTWITGTGLTHLGSMQSRDQMHAAATTDRPQTDSAKMFAMGIDGGRPPAGKRGTAPEWFYKGNGLLLRGNADALEIPDFALDGGEEPEIVACYVIAPSGEPLRVGFAVGNEWSDHPTEKINYLYLAPSKLRVCSVGPELIVGHDFQEITLRCTVERKGELLYDSGPLGTGERHMCHSLANLEDHHFKYPQHRIAGDVHLHFLGTSKLSFSERNWKFATGDRIRIEAAGFSAPLTNYVERREPKDAPVRILGAAP